MAYNFVKLSDVPVAEDGATHVLGTKDGQVVRIPASGLGAVALDLDIGEASTTPPKACWMPPHGTRMAWLAQR